LLSSRNENHMDFLTQAHCHSFFYTSWDQEEVKYDAPCFCFDMFGLYR